ncbi:hypothetical protein ACJVDH_09450 [Pedobacter sp. AW1-32]|uniref:hypothetical protein n=1 Tax=Pedobacter sp. AW1-32 TaxID=3383026 RepID=UPI003FEEC05B
MKRICLSIFLIFTLNQVFAQEKPLDVDYQYVREAKKYYAYQLSKSETYTADKLASIRFSGNFTFKKIEKILIFAEGAKFNLRFSVSEENTTTDNAEQHFASLIFNTDQLKKTASICDAKIHFILDDGNTYVLPFNVCLLKL